METGGVCGRPAGLQQGPPTGASGPGCSSPQLRSALCWQEQAQHTITADRSQAIAPGRRPEPSPHLCEASVQSRSVSTLGTVSRSVLGAGVPHETRLGHAVAFTGASVTRFWDHMMETGGPRAHALWANL